MMKRTDLQKYKGFTLIELLVTIAIIAVLAAILFPVFARARESARRSSCMSNLKQIGLGVTMYVQDYDERFPLRMFPRAWGTTNRESIWPVTVAPYIARGVHSFDQSNRYKEQTNVFKCPSSYRKTNIEFGNYGANQAVIEDPYVNAVPMATVVSPSTTYLAMDAGSYFMHASDAHSAKLNNGRYIPGAGSAGASTSGAWNYKVLEDDFTSGRHFGGVNMLFADGHVKWLRSRKVVVESFPCGSGYCGGTSTAKSAWNPRTG